MNTPGGRVAEIIGARVVVVALQGIGNALSGGAMPGNGTRVTIVTGLASEALVDTALERIAIVQRTGVLVVAVQRASGDALTL